MKQIKKNNGRQLSEEEIDRIVESQADDDSAWEQPVQVRREKAAPLTIPAELAARASVLAKQPTKRSTKALFLIGAGFNRDAQEIAGPIMGESIFVGRYQINCRYPLLKDLWQLCFPETSPVDHTNSIERHFQLALERNDWEPFKRLYLELMKADYYLVPALLEKPRSDNCYAAFFDDFRGASFLTFNYDSLLEAFLYRSGNWYPQDGYGLPVEADFNGASSNGFDINASSSLVLHLHGSLCVYTSEFEIIPSKGMDLINPRKTPKFYFDPDSISSLFMPYRRPAFDPFSYEETELRVIAPIPNKAVELKRLFVVDTYNQAMNLLIEKSLLIAIGYDFNRNDKDSYEPLLKAFSRNPSPTGVIIAPNAEDIRRRLSVEYPSVNWLEFNGTFRRWVDSGYPGLS